MAYENAQVFRLLRRLRSPDRRKQGAMSNDLARIAREVKQQIEFFRREMNGSAADGHTMRGCIDDKVAYFDRDIGVPVRSAPQVCTDARQQFLRAEWLRDVIVSSGVECFNLRALLVAHREHKDRHIALGADRTR